MEDGVSCSGANLERYVQFDVMNGLSFSVTSSVRPCPIILNTRSTSQYVYGKNALNLLLSVSVLSLLL